MKKFIIIILCLSALISGCSSGCHRYEVLATVEHYDFFSGRVEVIDSRGESWVYFDSESLSVGQTICLVFETNGTNDIYDDEIVDAFT